MLSVLPQNRQPGLEARIQQADTSATSLKVAFVYPVHGMAPFRLGGRAGGLRARRFLLAGLPTRTVRPLCDWKRKAGGFRTLINRSPP